MIKWVQPNRNVCWVRSKNTETNSIDAQHKSIILLKTFVHIVNSLSCFQISDTFVLIAERMKWFLLYCHATGVVDRHTMLFCSIFLFVAGLSCMENGEQV